MIELAGKVAFITGGGSGIGLGIARAALQSGMKVAFTFRRDEQRDEALAALAAWADDVAAFRADVTDRASLAAAADEAERRFGRIHVLVNNAGVGAFGALEQSKIEDWRWMIEVNLFGVVHALDAVLPKLRAHGEGGHVLNVGSIGAFLCGPNVGVYTASKHALRGLTECLRYDLAKHRIGVSLLCPGLTATNLYRSGVGRTEPIARLASHPRMLEGAAKIYAQGMDPDEVGRIAVEGIRRDQPLIFTHPEHSDEVRRICAEVIAALPDGPSDPRRAAISQANRARAREALARPK